MFLSLNNFFRKHEKVQYIFAFLPSILVTIYVAFFLFDLVHVASVVKYNDAITKESLSYNRVHEVSSFSETYDNRYTVEIVGDNSTQVDVRYGELIYSLFYVDEDWLILNVCSGEELHASQSELLIDDKEYEGSVADVYLEEDSFRVVYEDGTEKYLNDMASIDVLVQLDSGCRLSVSSGYNIRLENNVINYCSILPTDGVYYNENSLSLIRNISDDFVTMFLLQSNSYVVLAFIGVYTVLLTLVRKSDLKIVSSTYTFAVNVCALLLLVLSVGIAYLII